MESNIVKETELLDDGERGSEWDEIFKKFKEWKNSEDILNIEMK